MSAPAHPTIVSQLHPDIPYLVAFSRMEGLGSRTLIPLLQNLGSPEALWNALDAFLQANLPPAKLNAFRKGRAAGLPTIEDGVFQACERLDIRMVPYTDEAYPVRLREIYDFPLLLYVRGDLSVVADKALAVVGTRKASEYGYQVTEKLIKELKPVGPAIISGLAAGIDTAAHWAALNCDLPTAAVFGCGLDIIFPSTNKRLSEDIVAQGGVLISEYPPGFPGNKYTYPQRNRIVAGLSQGVLVVEGDLRSGALITARMALEEGRSVFAVPGSIYSPGSQGPHHLIRHGAIPVSQGEDIAKDLNWLGGASRQLALSLKNEGGTGEAELPSAELDALSDPERQLLKLIGYEPVSIDTLPKSTGFSAPQINEMLTMLELDGWIVMLAGAKVCRK